MKRLIMATMVTAVLASSTVWAADNAPVAAQQQTQQVKQTQKTAAAERISEQGLYAMRDVQVARLALFHGDPEKAKELTNESKQVLVQRKLEEGKDSLYIHNQLELGHKTLHVVKGSPALDRKSVV